MTKFEFLNEIEALNGQIRELKEKREKSPGSVKSYSYLSNIFAGITILISVIAMISAFGGVPGMSVVILLGTVPCIIVGVNYNLKAKKYKDKIEELEGKLNELLSIDIDEKAIEFYNECNAFEEDGKKDLNMIVPMLGQKYGFMTDEYCFYYYHKGESEIEKKKIVEEYNKKNREREEELEKINKVNKQAAKKGKEKYLAYIQRLIDSVDARLRIVTIGEKQFEANTKYRAATIDWAIVGGIGSALGGPALGMANVMGAQIENEKAKQREKEIREKAYDNLKLANSLGELYENIKVAAKVSYFNEMEKVLIDQRNKQEKFNLLEISSVKMEFTKGGNIQVTAKIKNNANNPTILSKPAIFDGVLKVSVYDKEYNKLITQGFYIPKGYGEYNYKDAGFKEGSIKFLCQYNGHKDLSMLKCEITADSLWYIEKSPVIFKVDNNQVKKEVDGIMKSI